MSRKFTSVLLGMFSILLSISGYSQNKIVSAGSKKCISAIITEETTVNEYENLSQSVQAGDKSITIVNAANLPSLDPSGGDIILLYQAQGAMILSTDDDSSYGRITDYRNAGNYEYATVSSVTGNTINLQCGLKKSYDAGDMPAQVILVPQYSSLTITNAGSITSTPWNGTTGGVVVIKSSSEIIVNGKIDATAKGFRGGRIDGPLAAFNITMYRSIQPELGAEKGESIAGFGTQYDNLFGGKYGRGAPANGGGGGDMHNSGGGGGSNGYSGNIWTGQGIMCSSCPGADAWKLDPSYITNGNNFTNSSGGGRGGYTYTAYSQDPITYPLDNPNWGGDSRREVGGLGGRPLDTQSGEKFFIGGGGGAGDANDAGSTDAGAGGGIIFIWSPSIDGAGTIESNGEHGGNTKAPHIDGASGGGAGGSIVLFVPKIKNVKLNAKGGEGGSQIADVGNAEGPGGGGSGGVIASPASSLDATVKIDISGGINGTSYSQIVQAFPADGATSGNSGNTTIINLPMYCSNLIAGEIYTDQNICTNSTPLSLTEKTPASGGICNSYTYSWEKSVDNGSTWTKISNTNNIQYSPPALTVTTFFRRKVYCLGNCNSDSAISVAVIITVNPNPDFSVTNSNAVCAGTKIDLKDFILDDNTIAGTLSYHTASPANASNKLPDSFISPNKTGTYYILKTTNQICSIEKPLLINVNPIPTLTANNNQTICEGGTIQLSATGGSNARYQWSGPNNFISHAKDTTLNNTATTNAGDYTVSSIENGCSSLPVKVNITINPLPIITVNAQNPFTCSGKGFVKITISNPAGTYDIDLDGDGIYEAEHQGMTPNSGIILLENLPIGSKVNAVKVKQINSNCESSPDLINTVIKGSGNSPDLPQVNNSTLCKDQNTSALISQASPNADLKWYDATGNVLASAPTPITTQFGTLTYYVSQVLDGCESEKATMTVTIEKIGISAGPDKFINEGEQVELEGNSTGNYSYQWSPSLTLNDATILKPIASPVATTLYTIIAKSSNGCIDSSEVMVKIIKKIHIPDAFSPNGDGLNDTWVIDGIEDYPHSSVKVFNRWGTALKEIRKYSPENEWDGTLHGNKVPIATYYYVVDLGNGSKPYQGSITIVR